MRIPLIFDWVLELGPAYMSGHKGLQNILPPAGGYGPGRGGLRGRGAGRGRARGDIEPQRIGPPGEAQRGTAARPGTDVVLPGTNEMERSLAASLSTITDSMKVRLAGRADHTLCIAVQHGRQEWHVQIVLPC